MRANWADKSVSVLNVLLAVIDLEFCKTRFRLLLTKRTIHLRLPQVMHPKTVLEEQTDPAYKCFYQCAVCWSRDQFENLGSSCTKKEIRIASNLGKCSIRWDLKKSDESEITGTELTDKILWRRDKTHWNYFTADSLHLKSSWASSRI